MGQGAWVLVVVLVLAVGFGCIRAYRDGRFRGTHRVKGLAEGGGPDQEVETGVLAGSGIDLARLGERATLLQFSSAFCAPCRTTRRVLADVASVVPGVEHVEVDAEQHLDLVRRLGILRTPTTLVLDPGGVEVSRATGAPRKETVLATLARVLSDGDE